MERPEAWLASWRWSRIRRRTPPASDAETSPAETAPGSAATVIETAGASAATVEIVLIGGRVLRAPATLPTAALRRLIGAVESA